MIERRDVERVALDRADAAQRQGGAERHAEDHHGEGPDQLHQRPQEHVRDAAEVAGQQAGQGAEDDDDHGRDAADEQRGAPAVEQAHGQIPAVGVRAEEVAAAERGTDRHPVRGHHVRGLAADVDRAGDVVGVGADVGDVRRVERRQQARHHDHQEQDEKGLRHVVAPQPACRQLPGPDGRRVMALGPRVRDPLSWRDHDARGAAAGDVPTMTSGCGWPVSDTGSGITSGPPLSRARGRESAPSRPRRRYLSCRLVMSVWYSTDITPAPKFSRLE